MMVAFMFEKKHRKTTFGSFDYYIIPQRDYDDDGNMLPVASDFELCVKAAALSETNPAKKVTFKCLNEKEVAMIKRIMKDLYPNVLIHFSVKG